MMLRLINNLGFVVLGIGFAIGDLTRFLVRSLKVLVSTPLKMRHVWTQVVRIGVESSLIIILTGTFTGLALTLQAYIGFSRFGAENFIGSVVAMGMIRELGPVLTALMVVARAGSAMTAELGTMQVTEQIDALRTLCIDPYRYLVVPRLVAGIVTLPCLSLFSMVCGIAGGYFLYTAVLELNPESYFASIRQIVEFSDMVVGLVKSIFFGLIIVWISSYYGFHALAGSHGVSNATTKGVVVGSIFVLIANYFLSTLLFRTGIG